MFCNSCGFQISNYSRFCPRCGQINVNQSIPNINRTQNNRMFNNQLNDIKFKGSSGKIGGSIVVIILSIVMEIGFCLLIFNDSLWKVFKYEKESRIYFTAIYVLFMIIFFILFIVNIAKISAVSNTYLCVTANGIYGVCGTQSYFGNMKVNFNYNNIITVNIQSGALVLGTIMGNYKFLLDDNASAANEIMRRKQVYK